MKICFLLQRGFALIGHALAQILQDKHGINEFCGYVYLRSSYDFLVSQPDVKYTKLLLDEDIHNQSSAYAFQSDTKPPRPLF